MKRFATLTTSIICCICSLTAQQRINQRVKIFETWIFSESKLERLNGVLYEVKDSSIFISDSKQKQDYITGNLRLTEISYKNIDLLKTRRLNNFRNGAIIGSVIGVGGTILFVNVMADGLDFDEKEYAWGLFISGAALIPLGAGIGAIAGAASLKRFNINGNYDVFNIHRSRLQQFSYVKEAVMAEGYYSNDMNINEAGLDYLHKGYLGFVFDVSFPLGDFADSSPDNEMADSAGTGGVANLVFGYRFTDKIGVTGSFFSGQYMAGEEEQHKYFGLNGILAGPVFSIPIEDRTIFEFKTLVGQANSHTLINNIESRSGKGLILNFAAALRFNFSQRWCIIGETGYMTTNQKYGESVDRRIQSINLGLGIGYRIY